MADAPRALGEAGDLAQGARMIGFVLWSYADPRGDEAFAWPSAATLGRRTAQTERTARRHLAALVAAGWIRRGRRPDSRGRVRFGWILNRVASDTVSVATRVASDTVSVATRDASDTLTVSGATPEPCRERHPNRVASDTRVNQEHTREPTTTLAPGGGVSSGVLFEIDQVRREVEGETGRKFGPLTTRADRLTGLEVALAESGLAELLEVVRFRCRRVAAGEISQKLWRSTFAGDGYHAAREAYLEDLARRAAEEKRKAAAVAEAEAIKADALTPERLAEITAELGGRLGVSRET